MLAYGAKRKDWDYVWIAKDQMEIIVYNNNRLNRKRARRQGKEVIEYAINEITASQELDELDNIAEMYGDYDDL